ncbi:hypothetical protein E2C01_099757 [Portunus trituberculatus]|uniref:Uncharacterized protein n=1 Tax=Portunus trituberculatus TaxID=210409 RepID=A0A5B7KB89_PORTR|nr:hypothetical protein [Portunus trituberculatus]
MTWEECGEQDILEEKIGRETAVTRLAVAKVEELGDRTEMGKDLGGIGLCRTQDDVVERRVCVILLR